MGTVDLPYYYGLEGLQYAFYRIPKLLIVDDRFQGLSTDAKLYNDLLQKIKGLRGKVKTRGQPGKGMER